MKRLKNHARVCYTLLKFIFTLYLIFGFIYARINMKKINSFLISLIIAVLAASLFSFAATALADVEIGTEISLPSSYVEYFDLVCPVDIDFGEDKFAILENDERAPQNNRLIVNENDVYTVYDLSTFDATEIRFFGDYILFLSNSRIYIFDLDTATAADTGMVAATSFSVCGKVVLTNTSSGLDVYRANNEPFPDFARSFSVSLQYAPETVVLADENTAYYFYNKAIYAYDLSARTGEFGTGFSGDAHYSTSHDGIVYFSVSGGIFRFDKDYRLSQINYTPSSDVQGIAINDGRLFACYKDDGAVNEVTLENDNPYVDNFTLFAITYDGDRINRLSDRVKDSEYSGGLFYSLDGDKIKCADFEKKTYSEIDLASFIGAGSVVNDFATDNKTLLFVEALAGGDTKLHLLDISDGAQAIADFTEFTSVTKVFYYEGEYYFINNKTNVSRQYAEVNRLKKTDGGYMGEVVFSPQGTGWDLYIDVFGEIYVSVLTEGKNVVISSERGELFETATAAKSPFVDFDGNVFYILNDNAIYRFDSDELTAEAYLPNLWQNAPESAELRDLVPAEDGRFYLLYNGFVLKTVGDMKVGTPDKISVPEDFAVSLNETPEIVSLKENGKLFSVSLSDSGEFFDYRGYKTYSPDKKLVLVYEFSKYSVLADDYGSYIARTADIADKADAEISQKNEFLYITNDLNGYALPVLDEPYETIRLDLNDKVKVVGEFGFNGVKYSLIEAGAVRCFIPSAFLKPAVADTASYTVYVKATVGQKGATVFLDSKLNNASDKLNYGETVYVVEETDGVSKIVYGNGFAYVKTSDLSTRTHYAIRNLLVILVLFVAILSTVFFLLRTRVFKKKN